MESGSTFLTTNATSGHGYLLCVRENTASRVFMASLTLLRCTCKARSICPRSRRVDFACFLFSAWIHLAMGSVTCEMRTVYRNFILKNAFFEQKYIYLAEAFFKMEFNSLFLVISVSPSTWLFYDMLCLVQCEFADIDKMAGPTLWYQAGFLSEIYQNGQKTKTKQNKKKKKNNQPRTGKLTPMIFFLHYKWFNTIHNVC